MNTARENSVEDHGQITVTGEVEMVPADKSANKMFTMTAKERYLWMVELKWRGRSAVSVLRELMEVV